MNHLTYNHPYCKTESWQKAIIIPAHKKGNTRDCENYGGINLLNSGYKICVNIIKNRLYTYYRSKLVEKHN
jgi:hypothetical protein